MRLPPADAQTEKLCLGSALLNAEHLAAVVAVPAEFFSTEAHRRIHARMQEMAERSQPVDRVTLQDELRKFGQLESVGGLEYLIMLDDGLPNLPQIDSYLGILRDFAGRRKLIQLGLLVSEKAYRGEQSPAEILAETEETWRAIEAGDAKDDASIKTPIEVIENFGGGIEAFLDPTKRARGLPTGFTKFDEMTGGLKPGELIFIAARPSHGKSSLALNIAHHLSLHPKQRRFVAFFSLEMSAESLILRMACAQGRVDMFKLRGGYLNPDERHRLQVAIHEITESRIVFDDTAGQTVPQIGAKIRKLVQKQGLHLAIIDYLGLISSQGKSENRNQEVSLMSRQLKILGKELGIPLIVLSQLSRQSTQRGDPRPQLSDLRDSGSLEQDADVVAFVFREEMHKRDREDLRGVAELIIAKQRDGPIGSVALRWLGQFTKFENRSEDLEEN